MEQNKQVALPRKVLRADYSQSASHFPLVSRGKQCVSNCYMFLLFTQFVNIAPFLSRHDLHTILEAGDILYTSLRKSEEFLLLSKLPNHIKFRQKYYSSYVKKNFVGCMGIAESSGIGVSLESCLNRTFANMIMLFSFSIHLLSLLSIRVDFIMFLILTTGVQMAYVTLKESVLFQCLIVFKIYAIF